MTPAGIVHGPVALGGLVVVVVGLLLVDLLLFARGREPTFREGVVWSHRLAGRSGSLVALPCYALDGGEDAVNYTTVYLIERSLSLDNLFVFLLLFGVLRGARTRRGARLLFWGIAPALVLRGVAILGGVALIERFHFVIYVLGVLLLFLAYRILRGVERGASTPTADLVVRLVRRVFPVTERLRGRALFVTHATGTALVTPLFALPRGDRRGRHRVRGRLDPGGVRDHARLVADLDGQRLRPARPARAVRARRGARSGASATSTRRSRSCWRSWRSSS